MASAWGLARQSAHAITPLHHWSPSSQVHRRPAFVHEPHPNISGPHARRAATPSGANPSAAIGNIARTAAVRMSRAVPLKRFLLRISAPVSYWWFSTAHCFEKASQNTSLDTQEGALRNVGSTSPYFPQMRRFSRRRIIRAFEVPAGCRESPKAFRGADRDRGVPAASGSRRTGPWRYWRGSPVSRPTYRRPPSSSYACALAS